MDQNELVADAASPKPNAHALAPLQPLDMAPPYMVRQQMVDSDGDAMFTPRFLWRAITQWWYVTLPVALIMAVISAAAVLLTFTPVYRSTAVLKIASYTPYIAYTTNEPTTRAEEFTETQIELLRSSLVMEEILAIPEIAELPEIQIQENAAGWLSRNIQVKQVGNSELYYVYLDGPDPDNAALLVNAILDGYFGVRARDDASRTQRVLELLGLEKQERTDAIQALKTKMRELGKDIVRADPLTGLPTDAARLGPLDSIRDKLTQAEVDRKMLEIELTAVREAIEKSEVRVAEVEVEMAVTESQEIRDLRALITTKRAMLHRVESAAKAGKNDPSYRRLEREIGTYERSLANAATSARPHITQQLKSMAALNRRDALTQLEGQLRTQNALEELWRERYKEQVGTVGESGNKMLELEFTRAELAREENVFEMIAERSMALTTESRAPGRVALLQNAEPAVSPVESIPLRNLLLAVLGSGCLPFGLVILWELSIRRICDVEQLTQNGDLTVVGEVARIPMRTRTIGSRGSRAMSLFEESIDSLRVGLVLPEQYHDVQVIAVTSAVHSEGKSSISSQLAVSIGRATNEPVLLIDGDLRAPDVHNIFQISNKVGLATVLDGHATLDDAIITDWSEHLHLLPAGRLKNSPHKLMSIQSLEDLLSVLRPKYRYIVIDTPPILSASEALLLAKSADGTVLCTRRNFSRETQVRIAYERLAKSGARPLGAVFNGVPTRQYAYTYGSYDYSRSFETS